MGDGFERAEEVGGASLDQRRTQVFSKEGEMGIGVRHWPSKCRQNSHIFFFFSAPRRRTHTSTDTGKGANSNGKGWRAEGRT